MATSTRNTKSTSTRNTKSTNTKTATAKAAEQTVHVEDAQIVGEDAGSFSMRDLLRMVGFELPSGKLMIASTVGSLATAALGIYGGMQLGGYLAVGALVFTGSAFLTYALLVLVALITVYVALIAAGKVGAYIASGRIASDATSAKNWVTGFFKSDSKKVSAA